MKYTVTIDDTNEFPYLSGIKITTTVNADSEEKAIAKATLELNNYNPIGIRFLNNTEDGGRIFYISDLNTKGFLSTGTVTIVNQ